MLLFVGVVIVCETAFIGDTEVLNFLKGMLSSVFPVSKFNFA